MQKIKSKKINQTDNNNEKILLEALLELRTQSLINLGFKLLIYRSIIMEHLNTPVDLKIPTEEIDAFLHKPESNVIRSLLYKKSKDSDLNPKGGKSKLESIYYYIFDIALAKYDTNKNEDRIHDNIIITALQNSCFMLGWYDYKNMDTEQRIRFEKIETYLIEMSSEMLGYLTAKLEYMYQKRGIANKRKPIKEGKKNYVKDIFNNLKHHKSQNDIVVKICNNLKNEKKMSTNTIRTYLKELEKEGQLKLPQKQNRGPKLISKI